MTPVMGIIAEKIAHKIAEMIGTKPIMKSKQDDNARVGFFKDQSYIPDTVRSVMRANSQELAGLTMKAPY
jgi:hypothetical protein